MRECASKPSPSVSLADAALTSSFFLPVLPAPPFSSRAQAFFGFMGVSSALVVASACQPSAVPSRWCLDHVPACAAAAAARWGRRRPAPAPAARGVPALPNPSPALPPALLSHPSRRADLGAAYGTAKSGVGIASMGIMHPTEVMKNIIPIIMAGILGIYGLIVAAILVGKSASCAKGGGGERAGELERRAAGTLTATTRNEALAACRCQARGGPRRRTRLLL